MYKRERVERLFAQLQRAHFGDRREFFCLEHMIDRAAHGDPFRMRPARARIDSRIAIVIKST
jgi:hypothetical protein